MADNTETNARWAEYEAALPYEAQYTLVDGHEIEVPLVIFDGAETDLTTCSQAEYCKRTGIPLDEFRGNRRPDTPDNRYNVLVGAYSSRVAEKDQIVSIDAIAVEQRRNILLVAVPEDFLAYLRYRDLALPDGCSSVPEELELREKILRELNLWD